MLNWLYYYFLFAETIFFSSFFLLHWNEKLRITRPFSQSWIREVWILGFWMVLLGNMRNPTTPMSNQSAWVKVTLKQAPNTVCKLLSESDTRRLLPKGTEVKLTHETQVCSHIRGNIRKLRGREPCLAMDAFAPGLRLLPWAIPKPACDSLAAAQILFAKVAGGRLLITRLTNSLLRQYSMCPPPAANCQVSGVLPVWILITPNWVLRFLHLSFCHKVCDYKSLLLIGSEVTFLMAHTCNKAIEKASKRATVFTKHRTSTVICIPEKSLLSLCICFQNILIAGKTWTALPNET